MNNHCPPSWRRWARGRRWRSWCRPSGPPGTWTSGWRWPSCSRWTARSWRSRKSEPCGTIGRVDCSTGTRTANAPVMSLALPSTPLPQATVLAAAKCAQTAPKCVQSGKKCEQLPPKCAQTVPKCARHAAIKCAQPAPKRAPPKPANAFSLPIPPSLRQYSQHSRSWCLVCAQRCTQEKRQSCSLEKRQRCTRKQAAARQEAARPQRHPFVLEGKLESGSQGGLLFTYKKKMWSSLKERRRRRLIGRQRGEEKKEEEEGKEEEEPKVETIVHVEAEIRDSAGRSLSRLSLMWNVDKI